ncbi:SDR family NAD(P)-dependent oxidoreductase [Egibacter rhizosphaerae]|uniref:SDR family NAD(P)-dependent oxidoreductase n=1 Tax=Egibacter rhizosphaerae TaxID=1670831 RepID=UPI0013F151E5|nr:SDR family NAD(P)-dependent oxidoreductase [Egibacter rhizosphaerae]
MDPNASRNCLVAGGGGALGRAVVAELLDRGDRVCVPWIVREEAEELRTAHPDAVDDGRLRLSEANATDPDEIAALLDVLRADWGPLWLACSTVGGYAGGTPVAELDDLTEVDRLLTLNLKTAFVVAREGLRHMREDAGRVVLVGARQAVRPGGGDAPYTAAKSGVLALTESLAAELKRTGRTANCVLPGMIDTAANRAAMPDGRHDRWTPPAAIAKVIAWLASDDAWVVSGAGIPVYGDS